MKVRILIAASALALASCGSDAGEDLSAGQAAYEAGNFDQARTNLVAALKQDRKNPVVVELLARTYLELGDGDRAKRQLDNLAELGDVPEDYPFLMAQAQLDRGLPELALEAIQGEESAKAYHLRAQIQIAEGDYDEARDTMRAGLDRPGEKGGLYADYALFRLGDEEIGDAARYAAMAKKSAPDASRTYLAVGNVAVAQDRFNDAIAELKEGVDRYPRDLELLYGLARAYGLSGRNKELAALLDDAKPRVGGSMEFTVMRARLAGDRENWEEVRSLLQPIESDLDNLPSDNFLYITALDKLGQTELAYNRLQRLVRRFPGNQDAEAMLARLESQLG